ncbi:MAG: SpoIID/LytB domain-containing protein [Elusimicrobia bacterium]|nr:SpoIID/LytB domain-containing protein [Elusimicrobiota bacterium]
MPALLLAAVLAWSAAAPAPQARAAYNERLIQIGVLHGVRRLIIKPEGRFTLRDAAGRWQEELLPYKDYRVSVDGDDLIFGPFHLRGQARLVPQDPQATVLAGSGRYRGSLIVKPVADDSVTVVAEMGVEEYLLGVVPREMEPGWPREALKAQAVVARTFAYHHLGKYRKSGFDLTSDTRSQVYGGVGADNEAVRRAVAETRGEVLGFKGELLDVYYHACCGGHTADYGQVWGQGATAPVPLRGVKDRYCAKSPLGRWRVLVSKADVLAALQSRRLVGGRLKSFRLGRRDGAGYLRTFLADIGGEAVVVSAEAFRKAVGPTVLRSLRLRSAKLRRQGVEFEGAGSGHGVGLCQWGARMQADAGRGYEKILQYYFPGSTLSVVDE